MVCIRTSKNLHPNTLSYFSLFNAIFSHSIYPHSWKTIIILLTLKPNADHFLIMSYRPIALSGIFGILSQTILNKCLVWFLESNNLLSSVQHGFRKRRNTTQPQLDLQTEINISALQMCILHSVFFDPQEVFHPFWNHYFTLQVFTTTER